MQKVFILSPAGCLMVLCGLFFACKKGVQATPPPAPPPAPLAIGTVNPLAGEVAATVTITGTGFSAMLSADSVFFNGKNAVISAANDTQLVVSVPSLAGTGNITVKINGVSVTGPSFTYNYQYVVSTFAGIGLPGETGGSTKRASFNNPYGIAVAGDILYIADEGNNQIRMIGGGSVFTQAGYLFGNPGLTDGIGDLAGFHGPTGIAADNTGNLYVADMLNNNIRLVRLQPDNPYNAVVSTLAGSAMSLSGAVDGVDTAARFARPRGIAFFDSDFKFVTDSENHTIRSLTPAGIETIAGNPNSQGSVDGIGTAASFVTPEGIAVDSSGTIYISDSYNCNIRVISPRRVVSTLAGSTTHQSGAADGAGTAAGFNSPTGVALDGKGNLYVVDKNNNTIRKIVIRSGLVTTVAGDARNRRGSTDGIGRDASFNGPIGIAIDAMGNLYVADTGNNNIREIILQ